MRAARKVFLWLACAAVAMSAQVEGPKSIAAAPEVQMMPMLRALPIEGFAKGLDGGYLYYRHISREQFAEVLSGFKGHPVPDNTGLTGFYDVRLDIFEDPADMKKSMIRGDFGDVAAAAVESQLGLRMEPRKGPIPMLIVDEAEKIPIEN